MKPQTFLIGLGGLVLLAILSAAVILRPGAEPEPLDIASWNELSPEEQQAELREALSGETLPADREIALLAWGFINHPDLSEQLLRERRADVPRLPFYISETSLLLVRNGASQPGFRLINLGLEFFPNNPDVLGASGIVNYLAGERETARQFLEEASTWKQNRPIVDFYLGGLLVTEASTADRTRGKALLTQVLNGEDEELSELSGLTLLTGLNIPLIREDLLKIYDTLDDRDVFRSDNPNLSAEALRVMINRFAPVDPEASQKLAGLLMDHAEATTSDKLGYIQLSQAQMQTEAAAAFMDEIEVLNEEGLLEPEAAARFARLQAVQFFLERSYTQGLASLENIVRSPEADHGALQQTFQNILQIAELPLDVQRDVLGVYLELPTLSVENSLQVLNRLTALSPLRQETHVDYALENLFPEDSLAVSRWLLAIGEEETVIDALEGKETWSQAEIIILANTYLDLEDPANARRVLESQPRDQRDPAFTAFLFSRVALLEGNTEAASAYWEEATQAVTGTERFPLLKSLGFLALQLDQPVTAMTALQTALAAGIPFSPAEAESLLQLTLTHGRLDQCIEIAQYLTDLQPDSPVALNNLAYFNFLREVDMDASIEKMREVVDEFPEIPQYTLTLALGLIKAGRANEAGRLLRGATIDWAETNNRSRLIYAVVLAATDQRVVAEGLIQDLDLSGFIPEERALLEAF